jgi:hypothetical protein
VSPEDIPRETSLESILQQMAHGLSMTTEILREMQVSLGIFSTLSTLGQRSVCSTGGWEELKEQNRENNRAAYVSADPLPRGGRGTNP